MSESFSLYTLFLTSKAPGCLFLSCETFKGLFWGGMRPADCAPKSVLPPPALFCCCFQISSAANWGPAPVFMLASIPCSAGSVTDALRPAAVQSGSGNRLSGLSVFANFYQCFSSAFAKYPRVYERHWKRSPPANPVNLTKPEFQSTSFVSFSPLLS